MSSFPRHHACKPVFIFTVEGLVPLNFLYIKFDTGNKGEVCRQLKIFLTPPVVYGSGVVLNSMQLCGLRITRGAWCFKVFSCSLSSFLRLF